MPLRRHPRGRDERLTDSQALEKEGRYLHLGETLERKGKSVGEPDGDLLLGASKGRHGAARVYRRLRFDRKSRNWRGTLNLRHENWPAAYRSWGKIGSSQSTLGAARHDREGIADKRFPAVGDPAPKFADSSSIGEIHRLGR